MARVAQRLRIWLPLVAAVLVLTGALAVGRDHAASRARAGAGAENGAVQPPPAVEMAPATQTGQSPPAERAVSLTLLGASSLGGGGFHGDVWGHKGFAYVGTWGSGSACPSTGVKIVDLTDPSDPRLVGAVAAFAGTSQEDMAVQSVTTPAFTGDLLIVGIQICGQNGPTGMSVWDVTDPRNPAELSFFHSGARGVHELDLVQQGGRVLALLAVPYSEARGGPGDFRIVDLTDPRNPVQLSSWGIGRELGVDTRGGEGCTHTIYDHSARASRDGRRAYLSYWDENVIVLDISDPTAPRFLGQLRYAPDEEGATHSVADTEDGRYLLIADEDDVFRSPLGLRLRVASATGPVEAHGCESLFSRPLESVGLIQGSLLDAGSGCPGALLPLGLSGGVALVSEGGCPLLAKADYLAAAGARAVVAARADGAIALSGSGRAAIPIILIDEADAARLRTAAAPNGAPLTLPSDRRWSGLRIWDVREASNAHQVGIYQTPNSLAFPPPGPGYYTIHNPQTVGTLAFLSWYSDGLRVVDIRDPAAPRALASYVPPPSVNPLHAAFPDGTLVWGVALMGDLVLISDINGGLSVLRWTETH